MLPDTVRLVSAIEPNLGWLRCDREQLEQVLTNLVINARDAVGDSGTVTVAARRDGHAVHVSVLDDGCGIPEALLDRIFDALVTTKRDGTGLGLPIARRLIESHGGTLRAENRDGGGAAFHFYVPAGGLVPIANECSKFVDTLPATLPGAKRVLLVEDDVSVGAGMEALLSHHGFDTVWAQTAASACDHAGRACPEVAIIDINLPDGNGIDLIPRLRAANPRLPIIISSGHVDPDSVQGWGIQSLLKPYAFDDLLTAIARARAETEQGAAA